MQAAVASLTEVLAAPVVYVMPVYQRRYAWTKEDCLGLFEDAMAAGRSGRTHFMASILTVDEGGAPSTSNRRLEVIDGQQRLTTLSLLLAALFDRLDAEPDAAAPLLGMTASAARRRYLYDGDQLGDAQWRLLPTEPDRADFRAAMRGETPEGGSIGANLAWFRRRIDELDTDGLRTLWGGVLSLRTVNIAIDSGDSTQEVFESMNAKGEPLTALDLVRNRLLMGLDERGQEEAYARWRPIEAAFDADGFADFLYQWLVLRHHDLRTYRDVYHTFLRYEGDRPVSDVLEDLAEGARLHVALFQGPHRFMPAGLRPAAMAAAGRDGADESLRILDAYALRRAVCGLPAGALGGVNRRILKAFDAIDDGTPDHLAALLVSMDDSQARFPTDMEFMEALQGRNLYRRPDVCRRLLEGLEDAAHPNERVTGLTIEHILPRNPGSEWPAAMKRAVRDLGGTLGNLTLTGSNSMLGNRGFAYKRDLPDYGYKASPLWLNQGLGDLDEWNTAAIRDRGRRLAEAACRLAPYPKAYADLVAHYATRPRVDESPMPTALAGDGACHARFEALSALIARLHPDWERRVRRDYVGWYARRLKAIVIGTMSGRMHLSVSRTDLDDPRHLLSSVGTNAGLPLAMPVDDDLTGVEDILRQL